MTTTTTRRARHGLRIATGILAAVLALGAFAGTASAKEIGSGGGGGGGTATCNPVTSLSYKGDATTSDTAAATVKVTYGVRSCTRDAVRATVTMFQSAVPSNVVYSDPAAPLSGKFTVGVIASTSYQVRVDVFDVATGAKVGSQTIFAAAVRKTGV